MSRWHLILPLTALLVACGEQEVTGDDTGNDDTGAPGYTVDVTASEGTAQVDLSTLDTVDLGGDAVVPVTAVLEASGVGATWADLVYDFVASDGYRPSDRDCGPVDHTTVAGAYLYPETGNLTWDDALGMQGCFFVDGVVTVEAQVPTR